MDQYFRDLGDSVFILVNLILILNPERIIFTGYKLNDKSKLIM